MKFKISYRAECGCLMRYDMELDIFSIKALDINKKGRRFDCTIVPDPEDKTEYIELQPTCQLHVREANEHTNPSST